MKHLSYTIATFLALTTPAWSLSCLRPDIVRTYEKARDSTAGFWIVMGEIISDRDITMPPTDPKGRYKENASASTAVAFSGVGLTSDGTYQSFAQDITLTVTCFAHWCGTPPLGQHVFAAIEVKDTGPELIIDPCSSRVVPYSEDANDRLLNCVKNNICEVKY